MYEKKKTVLILILFSVLLLTGCSRKIFIRTYCDSVINNNINPLQNYASNNKSVYATLATSVILIKNDINLFNSYVISFKNQKNYNENDIERLKIMMKTRESLKIRINSLLNSIHKLDRNLDKNEIPILGNQNSYYSGYYNRKKGFFSLIGNLQKYYSALEYCINTSQIKSFIKISNAQNAFEEYIDNPSDSLYKTIRMNFANDIKYYKKYSNGLQSKKGDATSFIFSYFLEKSDSAMTESSYYNAKLQIAHGDVYTGLCSLQLAYCNNKNSDIKNEIISLVEKLDSESKLSVYLSTISFENIYTNELLQEVFIKTYTFGYENPIILMVKINLTNYSNKATHILEYVPKFEFIKNPGFLDGNNKEIEQIALFSISKLEPKYNYNHFIFPGKSSEETFYYFLNSNFYFGNSILDSYKKLFNRINDNINSNLVTNIYNEGKANIYIKKGNQNYPIDNLIKIK